FLSWWAERLETQCVFDPPKGLYRDQGWLALVPCYFEYHILRDPGCNVAYWNVRERNVTWTGKRYKVDGGPLRSFHFSGFDPAAPGQVSRFARGDFAGVATEPVVRICRQYARRLREHAYVGAERVPPA